MAIADVPAALALLQELGAPAYLVRHHELVAEAAAELVHGLRRFAEHFDAREVLVGAAIHDVGKILHPAEMTGPGSEHEAAGERVLREHGLGGLARFSRTHARWNDDGVELEDLLVAAADKLWKGKREAELEKLVIARLAAVIGESFWDTFVAVDDLFERVAAGGDRRLARSTR